MARPSVRDHTNRACHEKCRIKSVTTATFHPGWGLPGVLALRIGYAGPATTIDTGTVEAIVVLFTWLAVCCATAPERGAVFSVAKPVAALAIVRATPLRHVLGPGYLRAIVHDELVARRELDSIPFLKLFGPRKGALLGRCRHFFRRRWRWPEGW
jgi:hypothetical protein